MRWCKEVSGGGEGSPFGAWTPPFKGMRVLVGHFTPCSQWHLAMCQSLISLVLGKRCDYCYCEKYQNALGEYKYIYMWEDNGVYCSVESTWPDSSFDSALETIVGDILDK